MWGGGHGRTKRTRAASKVFGRDRNVVRLGKGREPYGLELGVSLSHFQGLGTAQGMTASTAPHPRSKSSPSVGHVRGLVYLFRAWPLTLGALAV